MKTIKQLVRKAGNPLAQCVRRLSEQRNFSNKSSAVGQEVSGAVEHDSGPVPDGYEQAIQFLKLKSWSFTVNVKQSPSDCCVTIKDRGPVLVVNVLSLHGCLYFVCKAFKMLTDYFTYPLHSSSIGIYKVSGLSKEIFAIPVSQVQTKCVCLPCSASDLSKHEYAVFPIVHSLTENLL